MAEVDTSIYRPPERESLLGKLGSVAQTQNLLNQNRLFNQQINTNTGVSQIYKEAIDPQTGQIDGGKLRALLADPKAGENVTLGLPQAVQQSQAAQLQQIQINNEQFNNAKNHITAMWDLLSNVNPREGAQGVWKTIGKGISLNLFTPDQISAELTATPIPSDPKGIEAWKNQYLMQLMSSGERLNAQYGQVQNQDTGNAIVQTQTPQLGGGPMQVRGGLQKALSPGDAATPVQVFDPTTKQPIIIPKSQFAGQTMGGAQTPDMGSGRYAGEQAPQGQQGGMGGMPAGPALGQTTAADVMGHESASQGVGLQKRADSVPQMKTLLGNLEARLDEFGAGPGANWKNVAKAFVNANNPLGNVFDPKSIASQEEFTKQATQLAQTQFQALGGTGTDSKLDSAMHTSPNAALSSMGNKGIIAMLKGNEDAISAKNQAWQDWLNQGHGPETYGQFSTGFNKSYDPRVFQMQYMTPAERQKEVAAITKNPQEKAVFVRALKMALQNGWIQLPGQQGGR